MLERQRSISYHFVKTTVEVSTSLLLDKGMAHLLKLPAMALPAITKVDDAARGASLADAASWRGLTNAAKGTKGEAAASRTLQRAGYEQLPSNLTGNRGIDGVFVKSGVGGQIDDIIVTESKFSSTGYASLSNTNTMGRQLSGRWIDENISKMLRSGDPALESTGRLLRSNRSLLRTKANVLDPSGVNRWNRVRIPE